MNNTLTTKTKSSRISNSSPLLKKILAELRLLRKEVSLVLPSEDLKGYEHPGRIKKSLAKALAQYPPSL